MRLSIWIKVPAAALLIVLSSCLIAFLQVKNVQFSYGSQTCLQQLTLLPGISRQSGNDSGFEVNNEDITKIGNIQLWSLKTCFNPKKAPTVGDNKVSIAPFGGWFAKKTYNLSVPQPPSVQVEALAQPISVIKPLAVALSGADLVFDYQLEVDNKSTACPVKDSTIRCDIASVHLLQGKSYNVKLDRMFSGQKVATVASKAIKTINATAVVSSSVSQGQIIFDNPKTFSFGFDKDIIKGDITLEKVNGEVRTAVATTVVFGNKQATVTLKGNLERDVSYEFTVDKIEAQDSSSLLSPYKLDFISSDGPIVISVSADAISSPLTQTIVLTFDQVLSTEQNITDFVSTSGIPTTISMLDNKAYISYSNAPVCTDLNINIKPGLLSNYGIIQNDPWSFSTRTICYTISTIGYSKEGRSILAYTFGSGSQTILYTGSIHGNELSAKYLMNAWVDELEANARSIPSDKTIVVVPTLNPDGVAADRRNNSDNVDLNRNFPTSDWQTDIFSPANQPEPGGGGATPLSEPESQAIAAFTIQLRPRLTMSFHSSAGYSIGNQAGDSAALAAIYTQLSGYADMTGNGNAFSYPITGTYDDWMREAYGLTSVLVELSSSTNSEFSRNVDALWAMARS